MRQTPWIEAERYRADHPTLGSTKYGDDFGYFRVGALRVLVSSGGGGVDWEHVSVSLPTRCPTWDEMVKVKRLFWDDEECVIQFHPPKSKYVNCHPFVLHLWKRRGHEPELPPVELIA